MARNCMGADGAFFSSLDFTGACGPQKCYLTRNMVTGKAVVEIDVEAPMLR
uniref:Uncharacterized protein n=1 Tax=Arundo donax TaxID=35708 RepID=A0A0A9Q272_ARUDO